MPLQITGWLDGSSVPLMISAQASAIGRGTAG
jgi:hypothetical protein